MKRFSSLLLLLLLPICLLAASYYEQIEAGIQAEEEGRFEEAIQLLEGSMGEIPTDSTQLMSDVYSSLLSSYFRTGKIEEALKYGEKGLALDEESGNMENLAASLSNMAAICIAVQRNAEAETYIDRSIEIVKQLGLKEKLALRLAMKGEIYVQEEKYDEAIELTEEALRLDRESGNEQKVAIRLSQLGNILMHQEKYARAEVCLKEAEEVHRNCQNQPSLAMTLMTLSTTARAQHHLSDARKYVTESIDIARQAGMLQICMHGYMELSRIYQEEKDPKAYDTVLQYVIMKDSIEKQQVQQQISDLEVRYQTREKEQQIEMDAQIISRQRLLYWALGGLLLLSVMAVLFLVRSLKLKEQNLQLRNRFDHLISHDLKNPALAQQQGLQQLCQYYDMLDKANIRQELTNLAEDANAQVDLLYDLLDWSSLQTGKLRYQPLRFDLATLAQEVLSQHRGQAQVKNIQLRLEADNQQSSVVTSDRRMVASILRNLLNNAIKFTPSGGEVEIAVAPQSITVKDNGQGFDVELQQKQQSSQRGTANEKGTALGLNLARQLAQLCHAELKIDSKKGVGTTIMLVFG